MIKAMNITRKLSLSFACICVSAAVMMIVFFSAIWMIQTSTKRNNLSQSIHAQTLTLETSILRQNSQFRGFLVTGDESYLKSYYEGRDEYDRVERSLKLIIDDPVKKQLLEESRIATVAWRKDWGDRLISAVRAGQREEAQQMVRDAGAKVLTSKAVLPLRDIRDTETKLIADNAKRQERAIFTAMAALVLGGIALIAIAMTLSGVLSRIIARPITILTRAMAQLAKGDNEIAVDADRADELGDMARAVLVFRDTALAKAAADRAKAEAEMAKAEADAAKAEADVAQRKVVETLSTALERLAQGDLTHSIDQTFPREYEALRADFNSAVAKLHDAMQVIVATSSGISSGVDEIAGASSELSRRTEQQAASLEETAAALDEITATVKVSADGASHARVVVQEAKTGAAEGGNVVREAISAMDLIESSSRQIGQIIGVIDEIAFQTSLLALNAGVEPARAGDAGRGFAVVASEVRALAQRSAEAAKEIKSLISASSQQVKSGVQLVGRTGEALNALARQVGEIDGLVGDIAASAKEQAAGLNQVNSAVNEMDQVTQQNAAMVEETAAATVVLKTEAAELSRLMGDFRTGAAASQLSSRPAPGSPRPVSRSAPSTPAAQRRVVQRIITSSAALAPGNDEWTEF